MGNTLSGDVAGLTGDGPQETGGQAEGAPEAAAGETPQLSAEVKAAVATALEQAREEWEGPGGPYGKMQSTFEKKITRLQAENTQARQARRQQAVELMDSDPREAAGILAEELAALDAGGENQQRTAQATEWVEKMMRDIGYNLDDAAVAEQAAGHVQTVLTQPDMVFDVQQQIARERTEALEKDNKELRKVKDQIPDLIRTELTRLMAEQGGPELTTPGGASHKNPIKDITSPTVLLTDAFSDITKGKS